MHFSSSVMSDSLGPQRLAHQAPLSMGFPRQEYWSGLPFPSPMRESEIAQSCPTLSDPMDCSLPGSSVHGIFQARVLEWGAIAFSIYPTRQQMRLLAGGGQTWGAVLGAVPGRLSVHGVAKSWTRLSDFTFLLCDIRL